MNANNLIRYMVDNSDKSQRAISTAMGKSPNYLGASMAQGSTPSLDTVLLVARVTGCRLFLEDADGNRVPIDAD